MDSVPATVLFDSGSTHTFIAETFIPRIGVGVEDLGYVLVVTTPAGAIFTTRVCVRGVSVSIQRHTLFSDFIVLPMLGSGLLGWYFNYSRVGSDRNFTFRFGSLRWAESGCDKKRTPIAV